MSRAKDKDKKFKTHTMSTSVCPQMNVKNVHRFDLAFPNYKEPKELGTFALDSKRNYNTDAKTQLKYLAFPSDGENIKFNLNAGYEKVIKKDFDLDEKLDNLLKWILLNPKSIDPTDFVSYRGLLSTVLCTPYENRDGWIICASKFRGTIYLCQFDTEEKKERERNASEREQLMSSWGYKFEQYLTSAIAGGKPEVREAVNENEEFCSVVRTKLNSHSLTFGAEMDCVYPSKQHSTSMNRYVELKTSRHISSQRQEKSFQRFKLIKWWAQSFLIGIEEIICGFRDDEGYVQTLQSYTLREIPKMTNNCWKPAVCMNFCDQFLSFVSSFVKQDDPYVVYKFERQPEGEMIEAQQMERQSSFCFLPDWFINPTSSIK